MVNGMMVWWNWVAVTTDEKFRWSVVCTLEFLGCHL